MDLGGVGLGGLEDPEGGFASTIPLAAAAAPDPETRHKLYGYGLLLSQEEPSGVTKAKGDDEWRSLKLPKTTATADIGFSASKATMVLHQRPSGGLVLRSGNLFSDASQPQHQQMLCFSSSASSPSSPKSSEAIFNMDRSSQSATLSYFHQASSPASYSRITGGYNSGGFNGGSIMGMRGPFTPSQWMELEHQALIYKYITANMPIPSNLLNPVKRALDSAGFSFFPGGSLRPSVLGWGSFHLGFSNSTDPEPGRCRRTDGKKWRCSRDAVADQKYCERHINRGRHRSRKPVEGRSGQSASGATTTRLMPVASSSAPMVVAGGGASSSLANVQQVKNLQPCGASDPSAAIPHLNSCRNYLEENVSGTTGDIPSVSMLSPTTNLKPKDISFSIPKLQASYKEASQTEFGSVSSDSLLNPSNKNSSFINCGNFGAPQGQNDCEPEAQQSLRCFIDDWPKTQSERSAMSWPGIGLQSDRTRLSMSIPLTSSSFMSASSPTNSKVTLSPLRLSHEIDPIQMGLGVGNVLNEPNTRQTNWWETSVGGPLGEVLHHSNSSGAGGCKNSPVLNLMTDSWDGSPRLGSSPTGVLQKTAFGSLSNSSAGSSPRPEIKKTYQGTSLCNDLLGTAHSASVPLL